MVVTHWRIRWIRCARSHAPVSGKFVLFWYEISQWLCVERVINIWNKLEQDTIEASSVNVFKVSLQKLYHKDEVILRTVFCRPDSRGRASPLGRPQLVSSWGELPVYQLHFKRRILCIICTSLYLCSFTCWLSVRGGSSRRFRFVLSPSW